MYKVLKFSTPPSFTTLRADLIPSDLRGSDLNFFWLFPKSIFCFDLGLPVGASSLVSSACWWRIGVPEWSGLDGLLVSSVLHPIAVVRVGVWSRSLSISRPISSRRSVSSGSSSVFELSSPTLASVGLDSRLEESDMTTWFYFFFVGIVGSVWLVLGSLSAVLLFGLWRWWVSQSSPWLNFPHFLHRVMALLCSSVLLEVWNFNGLEASFLCITLPSEVVIVWSVSFTFVKSLFVLKPHFIELGLFSFS